MRRAVGRIRVATHRAPRTTHQTATFMRTALDIEADVQRELLKLALKNSVRSIPLQVLAVAVVVYLGAAAGAAWGSVVAGLVGAGVAVWRWSIGRRYDTSADLPPATIAAAGRELEGNAALAGILWTVCAVAIYPSLRGSSATVYVVVAVGSVATAALFMALAGRAFKWLVTLTMGSLVVACVFIDATRSWPLAILTSLFAMTMLRASREVSDATASVIRHGLEDEIVKRTLADAKEAADAASIAKSQFLATMSHEIRTPMNGVMGSLELLRHSRLDDRQRRLLNTASASGVSLMEILNDVLDHSKIEAGKLHLARSPMSIHGIAGSVVSLFRANADAKGIVLRRVLGAGVPDRVIGDPQRLKQVLLNLVGNAIKFTERGSVVLRVFAEPHADGVVAVTFTVEDTGIGVSEQSQDRLFKPFEQVVEGENKRRGAGTGLGLAISQKIVEAMGGHIGVVSALGAGSQFGFTISLEIDDTPVEAPPVDSALGSLEVSEALSARILLVEDNEVNRLIAREMLESLGVEVVDARDGSEALAVLTSTGFDLVLMDCEMPVMNGYETASAIRLRERRAGDARIPIVALTANAFEEDVTRAVASGMDAHLAKPYTRAQLKETLQAWL